ncbi:AAA family ATPase [Microbaculum marinum]|uniref:AAA family ATPase n=1 Tax=Microbaculum marinum TaxID=1764581 RepID=A0AAW9RQE7_9HYPH
MSTNGDDRHTRQSDVQADVEAFLSDPATYGGRVAEVGRIDTHAAIVFLAGDDVYKIKRAVRFPFLDFSTPDKRRRACEREVELNRLTAPELYLGAVPIVRSPEGRLSFSGRGPVVEWAVHMRRFDETATFDRLAGEGALTQDLLDELAARIADLHEKAPVAAIDDPAGEIGRVALESCEELAASPGLFPADEVEELTEQTRAALQRLRPLIDRRARDGAIRRCHGDLHLGNVALIDGAPVIFDALEFDEALATIDVFYDLAFLLMDLWERGLRSEANRVLNRWLVSRRDRNDIPGLALLPLFLSMRAAIRAKVGAARATHLGGDAREAAVGEARGKFAAARAFLAPRAPRLVAVGGLSGTGKTTVAMALAADIGAAPGAIVVRSDVVRKVMFGARETERLPPDAYTPEAGLEVYAEMETQAAAILATGHSAILDGVHARPEERNAARGVATACAVPFTGIWLRAPEDELVARVDARSGDASDANASVVRRQLGYDTGRIDWIEVDAGGDRDRVVARVRAAMADILPPHNRATNGPRTNGR